MASTPTKAPSGFTLLEVIVVIVIIGVMTVFILSRYAGVGSAALTPQAGVLLSHLRYAQMRAMNTSTTWGIRYDASQGHYWLFRETTANRSALPGEETQLVELDEMDIAVTQGSFTLFFDGWGRPACPELGFDANRRLTLTLSKPGPVEGDLSITQNTGYIQWQR